MTETEDYAEVATPTAHAETHEDDGSDEVDITGLAGELADEQNAGKIKGKTVPAPLVGDDEKALTYDHDTGQFKYVAPVEVSDVAYGVGWDGVTGIPASKNALYDELETRLKSAAVISDNHLIRGDGGARGAQETTMIVSDDGEMLNLSQPAYSAKITQDIPNVTGDSSLYTLVGSIWTLNFDQGNNFSLGRFYAPIDGRYMFFGLVALKGITASHTYYRVRISIGGTTYYSTYLDPHNILESGWLMFPFSMFGDMDTSDTARLDVTIAGGAKVVDISSYTTITGFLVC